MRKPVIATLVAFVVVLGCGVSHGQEMPSNYEHLKCYDQLIGTWVYRGPAVEAVPGLVEEGDAVVFRLSFRWVLDKNAVETGFYYEVKDGITFTSKGLVGWDAAEKQIIGGSMNSLGGHGLGTKTYDAATKTWTSEGKGVDGQGEAVSSTFVVTLTGKDTIVWQWKDRKGGIIEGDTPKVTLKRAKRAKRVNRPRQLQQAE